MTKTARWPAAAAAPERSLAPGTRVDDYEIEQAIAETGVSIVYRAFDLALGVHVALEEYMPEALALRGADARVALRTRAQAHAFDEGRQAFIGEAQTLARCEHPALLRYERVLQRNGTVYRAMRLQSGPTLQDHRRTLGESEPIDAATLERWLDDLLGALAALHDQGRVHGALSPERIMLREDGHLLLLDFDAVRSKLISGRTQEMMAALQPCFAAPEQRRPADGQAIGPWSDLYALAATLRYCIDGEPPPPAAGLAATQPAGLVSAAWRRVHPAAADDAAWLAALDACLAEAPQDRPQSAASLRAMIDAAACAPDLAVWPAARAAPPQDADLWSANDGGTAPSAPMAAPASAVAAGAARAVAADAARTADGVSAPADAAPPADTAAAPALAASTAPRPGLAVRDATASAAEPGPVIAAAAAPATAASAAPEAGPAPAATAGPAPAADPQDAPGASADAETEAAQAAIAVVMADLEATLARVSAVAGEDAADTQRNAEPAATAIAQPAFAAPPVMQRAAMPWHVSLSRRPAAWIAAGAAALVAIGLALVLMLGERTPAGPVANEVVPAVSAAVALPPAPAVVRNDAAPAQPHAAPPAAAVAGGDLAAPAPPKAAAAPPTVARARPVPRAQCTGKSGYALYQCMQTQCAKRSYAKHPQCVRLLRDQRLD